MKLAGTDGCLGWLGPSPEWEGLVLGLSQGREVLEGGSQELNLPCLSLFGGGEGGDL